MSEQQTIYNQIDFVIKAPRFRIVFSYMDDKGVAFVREYMLRLLKITPCKPEQIARYFGFSQHETEIALDDLKQQKWIEWQDNGLISLSTVGLQLFSVNDSNSPKIPTLKESSNEYFMELLDNNFLKKDQIDFYWQNSIELEIKAKVLSEAKEIGRKTFQHRFVQLLQDDIIDLNEKDISLYKIDVIESKGLPVYFRFTQEFELLPETGSAKERHDIDSLTHQDNIQQAITRHLEQFGGLDNLRELRKSMEEVGDDDTSKILFGGQVDFHEFLKIYQKYDEQNGLYFIGQIYHQENLFNEIEQSLNQLDKKQPGKLLWIAPSDIYWGKQQKIRGRIQFLVENQKSKNFDFRLYLPLPSERNYREQQAWKNEFKDISEKILYGYCEGFLEGNTEILFLENQFAVVCYHAKLSHYPVTLPIGFMTKDKKRVSHIQRLVENYLSSKSFFKDDVLQEKDLGLLNHLNRK